MVAKTILGIKTSYLFIILIVASIGFSYINGFISVPRQAAIQGGDFLSISKVEKLNDPTAGIVTSTLWRVETVYGSGGTVSLVGYDYSTPNNFLTALTGERSSERIIIDSAMTKQVCEYPYQGEQLKQPQYQSLTGVGTITLRPGTQEVSANCALALLGQTVSQANTQLPIYIPSACALNTERDYKKACTTLGGTPVTSAIATNTWGISGNDKIGYACIKVARNLSKPTIGYFAPYGRNVDFEIQSTLTNSKGQRETLILDDSQTIALSQDRKVKASFKGGLQALNQECAEYTGFELIRTDSGLTSIITKTNYESLPSVPNFATEPPTTLEQANLKISSYNSKLDGILDPNVDLSKQNTQFQGATVSLGASKVVVDRINDPVTFPVIVYDISTQFLSVYEPQSKPEIVDVVPQSLTIQEAGGQTPMTVYVVNNGERANVNVAVQSCSSPNVNKPGVQRLLMNPGDRNSFNFFFGGTQGSYTCEFAAYDDNLQYISKRTVGININAACSAVPGGNYQIRNNPDGTCSLYCPLTQNSCSSTEELIDCVCKPKAACIPDRNLKECEIFEACTIKVKEGYTIDPLFGTCTASKPISEPPASGTLTCQQEIDSISCNILDPICESSKAIKRVNCLVIDIGNILFGICFGGFILAIILVFVLKNQKRKNYGK